MIEVHLVRHGATTAPKGVMIGSLDYPLSREGRHQALNLAAGLEGLKFNMVLTSPLARARETAELIWGPVEPRAVVVEQFREISLGLWEGLTGAEARAANPDVWDRRGLNMAGVAPPGGESYEDLAGRVLPAFDLAMRELDSGSCVLLVAHQAVNRVILCRAQNLPLDSCWKIEQKHCSVIKVDYYN
ncbi:MAG: histidine phosphatase family protein [Deltaproteobacteria bacterium]|jgi:broad specificity phosphatase PhoE|nr:histidine phosphatase family protein [Deltaproteobacteria bacterium]